MTPRPLTRILIGLALIAAVALPAGYYTTTHQLGPTVRQFLAGKQVTWPPPPKAGHDRGGLVADPVGAVAGPARTAALALVVVFAAGSVLRLRRRAQRRRTMRTLELQLGRDDQTEPWDVQETFESIAGALTARWYRRLLGGQDHLALEIHRTSDGAIHFTICAPDRALVAITRALDYLYPDVAVRTVDRRPNQLTYVIRLKKRRSAVLSLQTTRDYRHSPIENLVALLGTGGGHRRVPELVVQLVLTPAPGFIHTRHRNLLKRRERHLNADDRRDLDAAGAGSVVEAKELEGALETQHRSLLYFDLRIGGEDAAEVRRAAGSYQTLRSENELAAREMHLRHSLYADRIRAAMSNPIPSLHSGLLSTSELASMWHLPRARAKHANINRATVRRAGAPPAIERDTARQLLVDEHGPVSIAAGDRKYGHALIGGQGGGKSSLMARHFAADAAQESRAIVLLDPKGPLAELCLGLVPEHRTVHYLDLAAPELGINPLAINAPAGTRADLFVRSLIEANPPGAIQAASDSFLRQATAAVCSVEANPTLWHVYAMLDHAGSDYRDRVVEALNKLDGTDFAVRYWHDEFPALISDKGFAAQALNPPRNKLQRLLSTREIDIVLRHPLTVDLEGIIDRGEILIVGGAKAAVGEDNAILVMQLLLQLTHRTLQHRQDRRPDGVPAPPVSLLVDEAHNVLTASTARMLAEGRSAGLEAVFAWQYSAQIVDEIVRSGVRSLLQSISIFRMREMEDARSLAGLAMEVYSDRISVDQDEQERLRFSPDDIVKLPIHRAINLWVADGIPRSGFLAQTLPMEQLVSDQAATLHRQRQRERGGQRYEHLPAPVDFKPATDGEGEPAGADTGRPRAQRAAKPPGPQTDKTSVARTDPKPAAARTRRKPTKKQQPPAEVSGQTSMAVGDEEGLGG